MKTLIIDYKDEGKKISTYLTSIYPNLNVNHVYKALRKKDIKLNGKRISSNEVLHYNDELQVYITDSILNGIKLNIEIPTIYEDDNIAIFNKPVDLEVTGDNSLSSILKQKYSYIEPCHRIDRNTIGLVLFAKNPESLEILLDKFKNFEIEKHYVACCYGIPKITSKTLNAYLFKDSKKSLVYISDEPKKGYSKITTSYKLLKSNPDKKLSLLDVTLHTGKTHQIRAHLAHSSLPILGDGKYGSYEINKRFKVYTQCLCSYSISFNFTSDSGILNYLNHSSFTLKKLPYVDLL